MCGISGAFNISGVNQDDLKYIEKMNAILKHRGPDDEGVFSDQFCILGHRRLSIIDLSKDGHQPFASNDGRYQLTYNGEIYNYIELREELKALGWTFTTKTDTEVLLKCYQHFGRECLDKFNGMFAFAIYDSQKKELFLARDRVGIKPLYYTQMDSKFYFASEIKALRSLPHLKCSTNEQALFDFIIFNRTDIQEETFVKEINRIPKGHYAILKDDQLSIFQWWNPEKFIQTQNTDTFENIVKTIRNYLISAVELRLRSDVSIGSCLSGGLDSSIILGIVSDQFKVGKQFATFTASFPGHPLDEMKFIEGLSKRFDLQNFQAHPTAASSYTNLKEFTYANDEPTTGASFYSQYEVMRLASRNATTVLLDGQGGDENFAGYHYFHGFYLNGLLKSNFLKFGSELLRTMMRKQSSIAYKTLLFQNLPNVLKTSLLKSTVPFIKRDFFYDHLGTSQVYSKFFDAPNLRTSLVRHFQYKLEHLLRMEDRNAMAFSIETRLPYLDYRLTEYVLSIPEKYFISNGETKYIQKKALGSYTTSDILARKDKIGFGTPFDQWLQTPDWKNLTKKSAHYCEETFPNVFKRDLHRNLPKSANEQWKINQLSVWHQLFN